MLSAWKSWVRFFFNKDAPNATLVASSYLKVTLTISSRFYMKSCWLRPSQPRNPQKQRSLPDQGGRLRTRIGLKETQIFH